MANRRITKRERFVRVAEARTQKVLDDLHALGKCAAPAIYEYTEEDLKKIFAAIEEELQGVRDKFAGKNRFVLTQEEECESENEEEGDCEENNCEAGIYDCDTCPNDGDCIRQNE